RVGPATSAEDDIALLVVESLPLEPSIDLKVDASTRSLAAVRQAVDRWLRSQGCRDDETFDIALATSEAAANSIEHAYGAMQATFAVKCEHAGDWVRVTVSDTGRWRRSRPFGRGRGLAVMRGLMDEVGVTTTEDGTTVVLRKRIAVEQG